MLTQFLRRFQRQYRRGSQQLGIHQLVLGILELGELRYRQVGSQQLGHRLGHR